jgi:hypothetical protein
MELGLMLWRFALSLLLIVSLCAALSAGPTTKPTSNPVDENGLPMPLTLGQEEQEAGNPLAHYVELIRREREYDQSKMWREMYWDIRGTRASFLGDQLDAQACFDRVEPENRPVTVEGARVVPIMLSDDPHTPCQPRYAPRSRGLRLARLPGERPRGRLRPRR